MGRAICHNESFDYCDPLAVGSSLACDYLVSGSWPLQHYQVQIPAHRLNLKFKKKEEEEEEEEERKEKSKEKRKERKGKEKRKEKKKEKEGKEKKFCLAVPITFVVLL